MRWWVCVFEDCECDGWVCVFEVMGVPSIFKLAPKVTTLVRVFPTFSLKVVENTTRWKWNSPRLGWGRWTPEAPFVVYLFLFLLWIKKERGKDKTYIWGSVWWKTQKLKRRNPHFISVDSSVLVFFFISVDSSPLVFESLFKVFIYTDDFITVE